MKRGVESLSRDYGPSGAGLQEFSRVRDQPLEESKRRTTCQVSADPRSKSVSPSALKARGQRALLKALIYKDGMDESEKAC